MFALVLKMLNLEGTSNLVSLPVDPDDIDKRMVRITSGGTSPRQTAVPKWPRDPLRGPVAVLSLACSKV